MLRYLAFTQIGSVLRGALGIDHRTFEEAAVVGRAAHEPGFAVIVGINGTAGGDFVLVVIIYGEQEPAFVGPLAQPDAGTGTCAYKPHPGSLHRSIQIHRIAPGFPLIMAFNELQEGYIRLPQHTVFSMADASAIPAVFQQPAVSTYGIFRGGAVRCIDLAVPVQIILLILTIPQALPTLIVEAGLGGHGKSTDAPGGMAEKLEQSIRFFVVKEGAVNGGSTVIPALTAVVTEQMYIGPGLSAVMAEANGPADMIGVIAGSFQTGICAGDGGISCGQQTGDSVILHPCHALRKQVLWHSGGSSFPFG